MATTTYRFVGDAAEVFPAFSSAFVIAGRQADPNAEDFQQPGELRPGQEFEGPAKVEHVRIERRTRSGSWVPTVKTTSAAEPGEDETPPSDTPPTDPPEA